MTWLRRIPNLHWNLTKLLFWQIGLAAAFLIDRALGIGTIW